jgi:fatty acid desaturase
MVMDRDPAVREDLRKAWRTARRFLRLQREHPLWLRRQARADRLLAAEWVALIAVTYLLVFAPLPWVVKVLLLIPWSLYSSLAMDVAVHYFNHWPPFRREGWNVLLRALGVLVFFSPLEVRYHHWQHHRYNDPFDDPQTALQEIATRPGWRSWAALARYLGKETGRSVWGFLPWSEMPAYLRALKATKPACYREIVVTRWAGPAWLLVLLVLRPVETAFLLVPATLLVAPLASFIMNLTDHAPSDLTHPFRQATWLEPRTRKESLISLVNHQTAATHLTHHLFPQVHWIHMRRLQRRMNRLYVRYDAPRSMVVNSTLLGNPVALARVLSRLKTLRPVAERWPAVPGNPPHSRLRHSD